MTITNKTVQNVGVVLDIRRKPETQVTVNQQDGTEGVPKPFVPMLAAHLNQCWEAARNEKDTRMRDRLLACERQRRGEYDPDVLAAIRAAGGSEIFMMLTNVKCRAAASWVNDVLTASGTDVFDLTVSREPEMPPEIKGMIVDQVRLEAQMAAAQGIMVTPEMVRDRMQEIDERCKLEMREEAEQAAQSMAQKIRDQLAVADWDEELKNFVDDFVTFPTAIFKGPQIRRQRRVMWGPNFEAIGVNDLIHKFVRVSPYDIYPSPGSIGPQSGYIIERHRLQMGALYEMIGVPGYDEKAIREVLQAYPRGYKNWIAGDQQRDTMHGKDNVWRAEELDVLEYWGPVTGAMLKEWGIKEKLDPDKPYEVNAWWIGPYVIRAVLNPDPLGERPYEVASWEPIPNAFWGNSLPEQMKDIQRLCNAAARALSNNMGVASGPQVEVTVDRLPVGENITSIYPWKVWQATSDKTGGGQPGVRFFQPNSNAAELMNVYLTFSKQADEVTGIPNYVYGSTAVGGAGRTASGLSMLMDNAAKGIKQAIAGIDVVMGNCITRLYVHNMVYDQDPFIKGDFNVEAKGASALIQREQLAVRRREFLQTTANPIDAQIMGPEGRAYLLKDTAKALQMDADRLLPNVPSEFNPFMTMQQMGAPPQIAGPSTQTTDPAGNPAGGPQATAIPAEGAVG